MQLIGFVSYSVTLSRRHCSTFETTFLSVEIAPERIGQEARQLNTGLMDLLFLSSLVAPTGKTEGKGASTSEILALSLRMYRQELEMYRSNTESQKFFNVGQKDQKYSSASVLCKPSSGSSTIGPVLMPFLQEQLYLTQLRRTEHAQLGVLKSRILCQFFKTSRACWILSLLFRVQASRLSRWFISGRTHFIWPGLLTKDLKCPMSKHAGVEYGQYSSFVHRCY